MSERDEGPSCWLGMSPAETLKMLSHGPVICTKDDAVAWLIRHGWAVSVPNRGAVFKIRITDAGRAELSRASDAAELGHEGRLAARTPAMVRPAGR